MTLIHLDIGGQDYNHSYGVAIVLLGFCLFAYKVRRQENGPPGAFTIGANMQWPRYKHWTIYHWLPTKRPSGDHGE